MICEFALWDKDRLNPVVFRHLLRVMFERCDALGFVREQCFAIRVRISVDFETLK